MLLLGTWVLTIAHEGLNMVLECQEYFLNCVRLHSHNVFDLLLVQVETQLFQHLGVQSVPIVRFLGQGVGGAVVMHVYKLWHVVLDNLCAEDSV